MHNEWLKSWNPQRERNQVFRKELAFPAPHVAPVTILTFLSGRILHNRRRVSSHFLPSSSLEISARTLHRSRSVWALARNSCRTGLSPPPANGEIKHYNTGWCCVNTGRQFQIISKHRNLCSFIISEKDLHRKIIYFIFYSSLRILSIIPDCSGRLNCIIYQMKVFAWITNWAKTQRQSVHNQWQHRLGLTCVGINSLIHSLQSIHFEMFYSSKCLFTKPLFMP